MADGKPVDLALSDVVMPGMQGHELRRRWRGSARPLDAVASGFAREASCRPTMNRIADPAEALQPELLLIERLIGDAQGRGEVVGDRATAQRVIELSAC